MNSNRQPGNFAHARPHRVPYNPIPNSHPALTNSADADTMHPNRGSDRVSTLETRIPTPGVIAHDTARLGQRIPASCAVYPKIAQGVRNQHGCSNKNRIQEKTSAWSQSSKIAVFSAFADQPRAFLAQLPQKFPAIIPKISVRKKQADEIDDSQSSRCPVSRIVCMSPDPG